jgi:uncharacterized protein YaiE (UPF0345 family)
LCWCKSSKCCTLKQWSNTTYFTGNMKSHSFNNKSTCVGMYWLIIMPALLKYSMRILCNYC